MILHERLANVVFSVEVHTFPEARAPLAGAVRAVVDATADLTHTNRSKALVPGVLTLLKNLLNLDFAAIITVNLLDFLVKVVVEVKVARFAVHRNVGGIDAMCNAKR